MGYNEPLSSEDGNDLYHELDKLQKQWEDTTSEMCSNLYAVYILLYLLGKDPDFSVQLGNDAVEVPSFNQRERGFHIRNVATQFFMAKALRILEQTERDNETSDLEIGYTTDSQHGILQPNQQYIQIRQRSAPTMPAFRLALETVLHPGLIPLERVLGFYQISPPSGLDEGLIYRMSI